MAVDGVVGLDLPGKDDVILLGGDLEGLVMPLPAKQAGQDFHKAGVGAHEVVVDQPCSMHSHLHCIAYLSQEGDSKSLKVSNSTAQRTHHWPFEV